MLTMMKVVFFVAFFCFSSVFSYPTTYQPDTAPIQTKLDKVIDDAKRFWEDIAQRFSDTFTKLKNLFTSSKQEFLAKVNDTQTYLGMANKNRELLLTKLKLAQNFTQEGFSKAMDSVGYWIEEAKAFQKSIMESKTEDVNKLKAEWAEKVKQHWDEGVQHVMEFTRNLKVEPENGNERSPRRNV